jgi:hypothetical protein
MVVGSILSRLPEGVDTERWIGILHAENVGGAKSAEQITQKGQQTRKNLI